MRFTASYIVAGLLVATTNAAPEGLFPRDCPGNGCNRAISRRGASALSDCRSFFGGSASTVTSGIATVTATTTVPTTVETTSGTTTVLSTSVVTITVAAANNNKKRQATSTPAYASVCSNTAKYSSACSCAGAAGPVVVPSSTSTTTFTKFSTVRTGVPATVTSTVVSTTTVTTTSGPIPSPTFAFTLQIVSSTESDLVGQQASIQSISGSGNHIYFSSSSTPTKFHLDMDGFFHDNNGVFAVQQTGNDVIVQPSTAPAAQLRLLCNFGAGGQTAQSGGFTCSAPAGNGSNEQVFNYCAFTNGGDNSQTGLFLTLDDNSCPEVTLQWTHA